MYQSLNEARQKIGQQGSFKRSRKIMGILRTCGKKGALQRRLSISTLFYLLCVCQRSLCFISRLSPIKSVKKLVRINLYNELFFPILENEEEEEEEDENIAENKMALVKKELSRRNVLSASALALSTLMTLPVKSATALDGDEMKRIGVFEKCSPSVVYIDTFIERRDTLSTNILEVPLGSGSGFVWDKKGHIVTNYHVVRNSRLAQVTILLSAEDATKAGVNKDSTKTTPDGVIASSPSSMTTTINTKSDPTMSNSLASSMRPITGPNSKTTVRKVYTAKIVGVDPGKDVAVLKIECEPNVLFPISVGTSTGLRVGQTAIAIGNPFGLDHTLTVGVISGTGREVKSPIGRPISDVIQTDAAINPGNSGGPLLDSSGKLIGMNTAIYSPSGASAGIGFAIPIDTVKYIVETLIKDGQIVRPVLGISFLGSKQARTLGITSGVLVLDVPPGTPPAIAGLKGTRRLDSGLIGT
jgi:S1-C subfamily serine protease